VSYATEDSLVRCAKAPTQAYGRHCGHRTGRAWDTGAATHGAIELRCCWCGAKTERAYVVRQEAVSGHGPFTKRAVRKFEPVVEHWTEGPASFDGRLSRS